MKNASPSLGVVIVTYNSSDVIRDCLETLLAAAEDIVLSVVVVDNASPDTTIDVIEAWASGNDDYTLPEDLPFSVPPVPKPLPRTTTGKSEQSFLHLIKSKSNGGFAAGVNMGLAYLAKNQAIDRFWILNPDCVIPAGTPAAFARNDPGRFSLMGGRVIYYDQPDRVQMDGGIINRWTGVTSNVNHYASIAQSPPPRACDIDFASGASMVASREFYETVGPMCEDYFLYYEEIDWAMRRGDLPLALCPSAWVYHKAGTSIGSPTHERIATPFSFHCKHRARLLFVRKHLPKSISFAWAYIIAKACKYWLKGRKQEARAIMQGAWEGTKGRSKDDG